MNRPTLFAFVLAFALLASGASVWEGSAVVGGAEDFSGDEYFAACNSFPRNTSVEVSNLENGRTISVVINKSVDNPGVFIALSPKAAEALGMKTGSATRVRAIAKSIASAPVASPPATRPGETADPDYNPRALVERNRQQPAEAAAPAAASPPAETSAAGAVASAEAPVAEEAPADEAAAAEETAPEETAVAEAANPEAAAPAPEAVAAAASPAATEPSAAPAEPAVPAAEAPAAQPRPEPLALALPKPDEAPAESAAAPRATESFPTPLPDAFGGKIPRPLNPSSGRVPLPEPPIPLVVKVEGGKTIELGSAEGLERPEIAGAAAVEDLPEPLPKPDVLPEEFLPRIAAPAAAIPDIALAEIDMPESEDGAAVAEASAPESLEMARPSGPVETPFESVLGEPEAPGVAAAPEPEKIQAADGLEKPASVAVAPPSELPAPEAPVPSVESVTAPPQTGTEVSVELQPAEPRPPVVAAPPSPPAAVAPSAAEAPAAPKAAVAAPAAPAAPKVPAQPAPKKPAAAEAPLSPPLLTGLAKGSYYIQVGVYGNDGAVRKAVADFGKNYPLALEKVATKKGDSVYRLYVGPLSRDESGVVLYRVKSLGFKDAFVKAGT